tara:strand:+ start:811 stop:1299 length:489 start_codon:yes stop_codon:yes gene_type:complete
MILCNSRNICIALEGPIYEEVLDDIIEQGADCFDGDVPQDILDAAAAKLAAKQLSAYTTATARLAQYVLSVGRAEVTEDVVIGQGLDEDTEELVDVTETQITVTAIDPVDATVEQTTYDADGVATTATVENPLITADVAERATAQAVVDATPQAVIDTYNGE